LEPGNKKYQDSSHKAVGVSWLGIGHGFLRKVTIILKRMADWCLMEAESVEEKEIQPRFPGGIPEPGRVDRIRGLSVSNIARINYRKARKRKEP